MSPAGALGVPIGIVKFAEFELDGGRYELRRGDRVLKLEKIPMELLALLAESNGRLVSRDEIVEKIWGKDVFLDTEHGINTAIRKIRQVLGDDPEQPRFVQTVTGKGYRFIAPATSIEDRIEDRGNGVKGSGERAAVLTTSFPAAIQVGNAEISPPSDNGERAAQPVTPAAIPVLSRSRWLGVALVLVVLASLIVVLVRLNSSSAGGGLFTRAVKPQVHSLAVLPLENLSGDPNQEYFADGMTDELITMLAKNTGLRVVSRTSVMQYKKVHRPLADVARELGVDGILEGSVGRSGNRVHINAQLIYAPQDVHLWAESYDRDLNDLTSLQSDLARNIARQVGMTTAAVGRPERHINPEAHDAYLLGRHYWLVSQYKKSQEYFQKAIELQPDYAAAWSGVADYYTASAVEGQITQEVAIAQAEPAARKAIELDDSLADAHHAMAAVYYFLRWDWNAAEKESARAIELNPHYSETHHLRSYLFDSLSRTDESLQEERKAMELDPFARPFGLALALLYAHQFDAALQEALARSEVQRNDATLVWIAGDIYTYKGMQVEGVQEWERALLLWGDKKHAAEMQLAFRRGGFLAVLDSNLSDVQRTATTKYVSPIEFAFCYARLGRKDETIRYLERAYQEHTPFLVHLPHDPSFYFVHSDARYQAIIKKMGLPPV
ncbi:MAG TPA: winged helix-turn-helix domain-containing protein [Terriglobales bacterium]|nr:winged helix-turn-helix domain-containing protein [Terriglobales bacterium]